ncbi:hypothetical protein B4U80_11461 [Leptotrombidium deliense]|uniref:inositol-phosphate phosphatase n=1 Tax=Leptotrombidium deliense TaxID=299467 RepID=A0A443SHE8_9ACAR|nr:hypothetical protein B4U80_11461 [Leptotrombidium deliense]
MKMWPYMIRLNYIGIAALCFSLMCVFFLYSSTKLSTKDITARLGLKRFRFASFGSKAIEDINLKHLLLAIIKVAEKGGHQVFKVRNSNDLKEKSKGETKEGVNVPLTRADIRSHQIMVNSLSLNFPGLKIVSEENHEEQDEDLGVITPIKIEGDKQLFDDDIIHLPETKVPIDDLVVWIDPLDATKEFTEYLLGYVTTMVCVAQKGKPIMGVIHKPFSKPTAQTYWAWFDNGMSNTIQQLLDSRNISDASNPRIIVSRSHGGDVHRIAKKAFGDKVTVIPAGGSGYKTIELITGHADAYVHVTAIKKWDICAANAIMNTVESGKMTTLNGESITYLDDGNEEVSKGLLATMFLDDELHSNYVNVLKAALN